MNPENATLSATIVGERVDAAERRPGEVGRGTERMKLRSSNIRDRHRPTSPASLRSAPSPPLSWRRGFSPVGTQYQALGSER